MIGSWLQAARPLAQVNIAGPLLLGQAMAFGYCGAFSARRLAWLAGFGLLAHLFIVLANDHADREADAHITTHNEFSGGSRVIIEGKLSARTVGLAALAVLAALITLGLAALAAGLGPWMLFGSCAAALLLWLYSYPPARASYRGHGAALQGLGVGVVLPLVGLLTQAGIAGLWSMPALALLPPFVLGYAGNILTALPDAPGDRAAGKRTYPVVRGQWTARRHLLELLLLCACATPLVLPQLPLPLVALVAATPTALALTCVPLLGSADAENREECRQFVLRGGAAQVATALAWSLALVVTRLVG
ncbi:MAG: prenyltransferase [Nannocystaceae bacterium]